MKEHPLVTRLENLREKDDRAALARLRRGIGRRMGAPEMYPYVVPFLPDSTWKQGLYFLVASLFALHPAPARRGTSMGEVFRAMKGESDSIERRFVSLLSADVEDIGGHLRHAVSLAKSRGIAIDYHRLLSDLLSWDHDERFVQLRWARDFWGNESQNNAKPETGTKGEKK